MGISSDRLNRDLKDVVNALDVFLSDGMTKMKWFASFGTLLYMIRDKKHGKEFDTDVDISIVGEHEFDKIDNYLKENEFKPIARIIDDDDKKVLFSSYESKNGLHVDLFIWRETHSNYWHTYDYMRDAVDGIPGNYHFKSLPKRLFEGQTIKYDWTEDIQIMIPALYGSLLDYWYPNWFTPNPDFGVSKCEKIMEFKTCEEFNVID